MRVVPIAGQLLGSCMRLFVGIPLDGRVVAELAALGPRLRSSGDGLRWTAPESWHVTVQFLGNVNAEQYECLGTHLGEVRSPAVPVRLTELDIFERAGVFYAGVEASRELVALQQRVIEATRRCGFPQEERPFHPHITLARAKGQERSRSLRTVRGFITRPPVFTRFTAEEFLLYESFTGGESSRYEIRERFCLAAQCG
jgi:RNA 2',3'-cyclic 3'-phosphodiesterase